MGWTPQGGKGARGSAEPAASPTPPRRRRRTPTIDEAAASSPKASTGAKPPPGNWDGEEDPRFRVRVRLGKRWTQVVTEIKRGEYTWAEFCEGLDEEELVRCQLRAEDGSFKGRPPTLVPREFLLACAREHKRRFEQLFQDDVIRVAKQYLKLAQSKDLKPEVQAKMLQYAMERVFGGIPKDVRIQSEQPWEQMLVNVFSDEGQAEEMPDHLARRYEGYKERTEG